MFPNHELSDVPHRAGFAYPVKTLSLEDKRRAWEYGGVALNDTSQGLYVKLWEGVLIDNGDTGTSDIYVRAPGVPLTLLFSAPGITEIDLAFDQNMNPFIAYMQAGVPKFYWYDPTVGGMVHTALPSGCSDLRCALDEKRWFGVADSDIELAYVRGGSLYYREQRDRYQIERLVQANVTRLICIGMNVQSRFQFRALGANGNGQFTDPLLGDIVMDLCKQAGIPTDQVDTSELYSEKDTVPGLLVDSDDGLDKPISWLMDMFQFDKTQHGKRLRFVKRGKQPVAGIPYADLVTTGNKAVLQQSRVRGKDLPAEVLINHIDPTAGFSANKQTANRRSNLMTTEAKRKIDSRVVLTPDQAGTAALISLKAAWGEQREYKFSTTIRYAAIVPADVVEVEDANGDLHRVRITEKNEDGAVIDWEAVQDAGPTVYVDTAMSGVGLPPPISTTPGNVGDTQLEILNLPVQRDQDDELGLYIAARGASSGWSGYTLYYSIDGGTTYQEAYTSDKIANIGETLTTMTPSSTSVEVLVPYPLSSINSAQLAAGGNRAVVGDEEIQYLNASLIGMTGDQYHYNLTGIVRGVLHTEKDSWGAGIRFVAIDEAVIFLQLQREYYGQTLYYKAVSSGQVADDVTPVSYAFTHAASQTEWAVTGVTVTEASPSGITVSWTGSPRIGTFGASPYHSKYMIGYRVKFADGHTIDTTAQTVTYAGGLMGTAVEVRALNAITGEGPLASGEGDVDPGDIPNFLFSGDIPDGYVGVPYDIWTGECGIVASGGLWDANVRGFVAPGVGAYNRIVNALDGFSLIGIPHEAGTFTTKVYIDAASPDPAKTGSETINQSVTIQPRPTHGMLDLRFRQHAHQATMMASTPGFKKFHVTGACSFFFYGVTSGKVCGQFTVTGATKSYIVGISNNKGELTPADYNVAIGPFSPGGHNTSGDATYSVELDADSGDFWIYKVGTGLVKSGTLTLDAGKQYRICFTTEYIQDLTLECNGGNEAWFTPITQPGHGGIPFPVLPIPLAWGYVDPDYAFAFSGNGYVGAYIAQRGIDNNTLLKSNALYSSGKWKFQITGAARCGICEDAQTVADGKIGDPGGHDSVGWGRNNNFGTLWWNLGGSSGSMDLFLPAPGTYPYPIFALDADGDTLKICGRQANGDVVVLHTVDLPAGKSWRAAASFPGTATPITYNPPGPVGYSDAVVP